MTKNFFFQSEHVSSQIWCQKIFPLLGGGVPSTKKIFFQSEHVSTQIWCQKFFPLLRPGPPPPPPHPRLDQPTRKSETWDPPPVQDWIGTCPRLKAGSGTPPPPQVWIDTQSENITSRHPSDAGGKKQKVIY